MFPSAAGIVGPVIQKDEGQSKTRCRAHSQTLGCSLLGPRDYHAVANLLQWNSPLAAILANEPLTFGR